jgi:hypothetical protein
MTKPIRPADRPDATREEVIRALLDPDHSEADELGRTTEAADEEAAARRASPREQAAAPINLQKVDE